MTIRFKLLLIGLFILSVLFSASCVIINRPSVVPTPTSTTPSISSVLLTVNNEDITTGYFLKRVVANPSGDVTSTLQGLVGEYIIKQEATANGVAPVTDQDIDKYLRDEANATLVTTTTSDNTATTTTTTTPLTMSDADYNKWFKNLLNNSGLSATEYREIVAHEIQRQRLADILSADMPATMTQVNYGAILYSTQSAATAAKAKIDGGADFGTTVTAAAAAGQSAFDQAWEPYAAIDPQLAAAAQALEVGTCSDPITYQQSSSTASSGTVTGYVLLMVHEVKDNVPVTDDQKTILKNNGLSNWLTEQLKTATVVIHELNGVTVDGLTQSMDNATLTWLSDQAQKLVSKRPSVTSTETTTTPNTPTKTVLTLTPVANWSGTGTNTTQPFTIANSPWVIQWTSNPEVMEGISVGAFQIYVYNVNNTSIPVSVAANTNSSGADNSYVYQTGTFYLVINAANTNWTVAVQEYK